MDRFRVVIAGGDVAAIEALLRLRRLLGDGVGVTIVAPNEDFAYRALTVNDQDAELVQDRLDWVDADGQVVHTADGRELPYDALLVATGGRMEPAFEHVTTFTDDRADEPFHGSSGTSRTATPRASPSSRRQDRRGRCRSTSSR